MKFGLPFRNALLAMVLVMAQLGMALSAAGQGATVMTDKPDYAPGELVIITGTGWQPGETVELHILSDPDCNCADTYLYAYSTDGTIYNDEFLVLPEHLGGTFLVTATGFNSGLIAYAYFTDGNVTMDAVGIPGGATVNYQYTRATGAQEVITTSSTTSFTLAARNNTTVRFSYEKVKEISLIKYVLLQVGINDGLLSTGTLGYDYQFQSPNAARIVTANYGALVASDVSATYGSTSVTLTSTLYSNYQTLTGISDQTITFYIDGTSVGTGTTNSSGEATLTVNLTSLPDPLGKLVVGSYTITSSFGGVTGTYLPIIAGNSTEAILNVTARDLIVSATADDKVYDGNTTATAYLTTDALAGDDVSAAYTEANFDDKNVGTDKTVTVTGISISGTDAGNYNLTNTSATAYADITARDLTVSATADDKVYDGNTTATVTLSTNKVYGDDVTATYTAANFADPNVGTWTVTVTGISINGADAGNYNLLNTVAYTSATITQATTTTLTLSAQSVRYMDYLTMTAQVTPLNTATALTGTVEFFIGGISYGSAAVVPVPGSTTGTVQATVIPQVSNMPGAYTVTAVFTSTNPNYAGSQNSKPLTVVPRNADPYNATGFYTGDLFAWTTGQNTSTATVTLAAAIVDNNSPSGDVRGARVTFYFVNGSTLTPIPSAQNLPVGLIDVNDGTVGAASAIVQLNIGSANAASFQIAVGVSGAYTNVPGDALSMTIVTVSKPVTGGFIVGGGKVLNSNSAGYIRGQTGLETDYQFDVKYNNSGTNPKGKVTIMVCSYYNKFGILDSELHTYIISTNAISSLNVGAPNATGTFSAKATLVEQLDDLTTVSIEGNATFQMVAFQNGCTQRVAITLHRKAGGIWFSSSWDGTKTIQQAVTSTSKVYVDGGGSCSTGGNLTAASGESDHFPVAAPFTVSAYPNPSDDQFVLDLQGAGTGKVEVVVYDILGRVVKLIERDDSYSTIRFGEDLAAGTYTAEVRQGPYRKAIKLVKQ